MEDSVGSTSTIPSLSSRHSGVPDRLKQQAIDAKGRLYSQRTAHQSVTPRKVTLPPDTDQQSFDLAIEDIRRSLGPTNVELNDKLIEDGWYMEHPNTHDAFHFAQQDELVASAIVYPGSTEEVQLIVRWANQYKIPVYPISIGRNLGYGGAAPRVPGSVVIDLGRRMNRVLSIDGDNASCLLEPGVTYFKLYEEVQKRRLPLWIDCPDLGGGSVLGNAIDRGVGYTPYGDHFANRCGMELVLPDGSLLRTGLGALPGQAGSDNPCWQSFQNAYGPAIDGLFSQSNYGIITKMGFWLMPETEHQSYMVTFPREEDLDSIVDIIKPLAQKRVLGNIPQIRHVVQELAVTGKPREYWYQGQGQMPRQVIREHAAQQPCGDVSWVFYGTQYGDRASIDGQLAMIKTAFSAIEGSRFVLPSEMPQDHYLHSRVQVCSGVPILRELDWLNWVPNAAHLFFSPILPTRGNDARCLLDIFQRLHAKYNFDLFPTMCIAGREMHTIVNIVYDRSDLDAKRRATSLMREMIGEAAKLGYGEYRTHLLFADQVAETYSWNNGALRRFNETIKDALDVNSILAPGRNGIWGRRFRDKGWEILHGDKRDILKDGIRPRL